MITGFQIIEEEICETIKDQLDSVGILYRMFSRAKDEKSILEKITRKEKEGKPYSIDGKRIQDIIGIRIITYFKDDVELVKTILEKKLEFIDEEIDTPELTVFSPKRTNIVCALNFEQRNIFKDVQKTSKNDSYKLLDMTFELQLRTILSEGWHEVDHNLRYKCKDDWNGHYENERILNGIYANLETNDIVLKNLFNELAYKHFKNKNWEGLIRNKFRLRFQSIPLKKELCDILDSNQNLAKELFKLEREEVLYTIFQSDLSLPINLNNLLYQVNMLFLKNKDISELTPSIIRDDV